MNNNKSFIPHAVFDTLESVLEQFKLITNYNNQNLQEKIIKDWLNLCFESEKNKIEIPDYVIKDYKIAIGFLHSYRGSKDTFGSYRRELERLMQWSWLVKGQSFLEHKRSDIEAFIEFCSKPPKNWISHKKVAKFIIQKDGSKAHNPEWRPFEVSISKADHNKGKKPEKSEYKFSQQSIKALFGILSSFYNYLIQEEVSQINPVMLIRQKSKFLQKQQKTQAIRRLSNEEWKAVIEYTKLKAEKDITQERTLFMLSCLYGMYLRISELTVTSKHSPTMGDFFKDSDNNWWFKTVGKGNKVRQIAVSNAMLEALKRYREKYLSLPPLPYIGEITPLIGHIKNPNKPITSDRPIRAIIQECFNEAAEMFELKGLVYEANNLRAATVHWLRHTGISEDVKYRPREHVRDDAGHGSSAITDKYIDIELKERAKSAKSKDL